MGSCFICGDALDPPKGKIWSGKGADAFFSDTAKLLKLNEALIRGRDPFPFCPCCKKGLDQLLSLQDKLVELQEGIDKGLRALQNKIALAAWSEDHEIILFRAKVLGLFAQSSAEDENEMVNEEENSLGMDGELGLRKTAPSLNPSPSMDEDFDETFCRGDDGNDGNGDDNGTVKDTSRVDNDRRKKPNISPGEMKRRAQIRLSKPPENLPEAILICEGHWIFEGYEIKRSEGPEEGPLECVSCGWKDKTDPKRPWDAMRAVKRHIKGRHLGEYKCPHCGKEMASLKILESHVKAFCPHGNKERVICPICGAPKPNKAMLDLHIWDHKNAEEKAEAKARGDIPKKRDLDGLKKTFTCEICSRTFKTLKSNFTSHQKLCVKKTWEKVLCGICGKPDIFSSKLKMHLWSHKNEGEKQEAEILGEFDSSQRKNPTATSLGNSVSKVKKVPCIVCGKLCYPQSLKNHIETHKSSEERTKFPCPVSGCGKVLKCPQSLAIHNEAMHKNVKRFKCPHDGCEVAYHGKFALQSHILRKHGNYEDRPFVCDICKSRHLTAAKLADHAKIAHSEKSGRVYDKLCSQCPRKFSDETYLKVHENNFHGRKRSKQPKIWITCDVEGCGKKYPNSEALQNHKQRMHINKKSPYEERPVVCDICNSRWFTAADLALHEKTVHADKTKVFDKQCTFCVEKFSDDSVRKAHECKRHGIRHSHVKKPTEESSPGSRKRRLRPQRGTSKKLKTEGAEAEMIIPDSGSKMKIEAEKEGEEMAFEHEVEPLPVSPIEQDETDDRLLPLSKVEVQMVSSGED